MDRTLAKCKKLLASLPLGKKLRNVLNGIFETLFEKEEGEKKMNRVVLIPGSLNSSQWRKHPRYNTYHKNQDGYAINVAEWHGNWSVYKNGVLLGCGEGGTVERAKRQAEFFVRRKPEIMN